jgi:hypothetical protein
MRYRVVTGSAKPAAMVLATLALALACHGGSEKATPDLRVPECEAYGRKMASCFPLVNLGSSIATVASDVVERDAMRARCSRSLERISASCR